MIRAMLNLSCDRGHRFFSPTPALWRGRECQHIEEAAPKGGRSKRCNRPLHVLRRVER
jgi:hypothetical protein